MARGICICHLKVLGQPISKTNASLPSKRSHLGEVHQLSRSPVGLGGVEGQTAIEADHRADQFRKFAYRKIFPATDVDQGRLRFGPCVCHINLVGQIQKEDAGVSRAVAMQEFSAHRTGAPYGDFGYVRNISFVHLLKQCWKNVRVAQVIVAVRTIEVRRNSRDEFRSVLTIGGPIGFNAGNLGNGEGPLVPLMAQ